MFSLFNSFSRSHHFSGKWLHLKCNSSWRHPIFHHYHDSGRKGRVDFRLHWDLLVGISIQPVPKVSSDFGRSAVLDLDLIVIIFDCCDAWTKLVADECAVDLLYSAAI